MSEKASLLKVAISLCVLCLSVEPALACTTIDEPLGISVCVADTPWRLREGGEDGFVFYNSEDDYAASVNVFDGGKDDGFESQRAARLFAESDSQEAQNFAVLKTGKVPSGNFFYAARGSLNGRSNIYVNTISMGPTKTLRITTWRIGETLSEKDRAVHMMFGKLLKTGQ